jgi:hypothetical protein
MADGVLLDNDIVLKVCCYKAVKETLACLGQAGEVAVLGSAAFVLPSVIVRSSSIVHKEEVTSGVLAMLSTIAIAEPDDDEIDLAAEFETAALVLGVNIDTGESLLFAMLLQRNSRLVLTGDKRAIEAFEVVGQRLNQLSAAAGRVGSLEQLFATLLSYCDPISLHRQVCREPAADKTLAVCFACTSGSFHLGGAIEGLRSYTKHLRQRAPTVLVSADDLSTVVT